MQGLIPDRRNEDVARSPSFRPDCSQVCRAQGLPQSPPVTHTPGTGYYLQTSSHRSPQSEHLEQSHAPRPAIGGHNVINALIQTWQVGDS